MRAHCFPLINEKATLFARDLQKYKSRFQPANSVRAHISAASTYYGVSDSGNVDGKMQKSVRKGTKDGVSPLMD
jgi:hypothetical protein